MSSILRIPATKTTDLRLQRVAETLHGKQQQHDLTPLQKSMAMQKTKMSVTADQPTPNSPNRPLDSTRSLTKTIEVIKGGNAREPTPEYYGGDNDYVSWYAWQDEQRDDISRHDEFPDWLFGGPRIRAAMRARTHSQPARPTRQVRHRRTDRSPLTSLQREIDPRTGFQKLYCNCGHEAAMFKVKKQNHNHGRWFGRCGSVTCDFWSWGDGVSLRDRHRFSF